MKTNIGTNDNAKQRRQCERESGQVTTDPSFKRAVVATKPEAPVFRYVPKSRCKEGEVSFSKCITLESATKPISKFKETDYRILRHKGVLLTHNASKSTVARAPLSGFVVSSKGSLQEESDLPKVRTNDGFDPNAYKLMKKYGYDFDKPISLGHVIEAKPYGINETQKKIQEQGGSSEGRSWLCTTSTHPDFRTA